MGSSEERVCEGGGLRRLCVFGVLVLQGRRWMRQEPLLSMGCEGIVGFWRMGAIGAFGKETVIRTWTERKHDA